MSDRPYGGTNDATLTQQELLERIAKAIGGRRRVPRPGGVGKDTGYGGTPPEYEDPLVQMYSDTIPEGQYQVGSRPEAEGQLGAMLGRENEELYEFLTQIYKPEETRQEYRPTFVPGGQVTNDFMNKLLAQAGIGLPREPQGVESRSYGR